MSLSVCVCVCVCVRASYDPSKRLGLFTSDAEFLIPYVTAVKRSNIAL